MRMRKKANLEPRMEACAAWQVKDPVAMKGSWRSLYPQARELWVEIGCGKGKFTVETARANPMVLADPAPMARLASHGDSALEYTLRVWCNSADYWPLNFDLMEQVRDAFDKAGIEIPYPQMDVHTR